MHFLIMGVTSSGKTTMAKIIAREMRKRRRQIAILDPLMSPGWDADFVTASPRDFMAFAEANREFLLIVDESGAMIGRYNPEMELLGTTSRHFGHVCFFIVHRPQQLSPTIRTQCTTGIIFSSNTDDLWDIARHFNCPSVADARLDKGEFLWVTPFSKPARGRLDFQTGNVSLY